MIQYEKRFMKGGNPLNQLWMRWITELQAIAQNGLTFASGPFDRQRYEALMALTAEMTAEYSHATPGEVLDIFFDDSRYKTPNLDVRAAVFQKNEILMVQENDGLWTLPGGWADVNESPAANVEREVLEEAGLIVKAVKLIALYDKLKHDHPPEWPHAYKCFFLCERLGGELATSIETQAVGFFPLDQLPSLCPHRTTRGQIQRCFEHYQNQDLPTDFD